MAPEHVFHALVEVFKRKKPREGQDLQATLPPPHGAGLCGFGFEP